MQNYDQLLVMSRGFACLSVVPSSFWALLSIFAIIRRASVVDETTSPQLPRFLQKSSPS